MDKVVSANNDRNEPAQSRSRDRVAKILDAAAKVLGERGYNSMTLRAVANEADVKQTSIYRYWPNKQAIVSDLIDRFIEGQSTVLQKCTEMGEAKKRMPDVLAYFMRELRSNIEINQWIVGAQSAVITDPQLKSKDASTQKHFAGEFTALLKVLDIGSDKQQREQLGRMMAVFLDAYIMSIGREFEPSQDAIEAEYITAIINYLSPFVVI